MLWRAHQAPARLPLRRNWSLPFDGPWFLSQLEEADNWCGLMRPFCIPSGWLQRLPVLTCKRIWNLWNRRRLKIFSLINGSDGSAIFLCKREALSIEKNNFRSRAPLLSKGPYKRPPAPSSVKICPPRLPLPPSPSCLVHDELELWQYSNFRKRVGTSYIT